ncbi:MAG: hypothetical protein J7L96_10300 [Bacteroidales bacterium]|nr:hypothetical protein [Bacteroidales bacterium]
MVEIKQKGKYKSISLAEMTIGERVDLTITREPKEMDGKFGKFVVFQALYQDEPISVLIGEKLFNGLRKPLYLDMLHFKEYDKIYIKKFRNENGKVCFDVGYAYESPVREEEVEDTQEKPKPAVKLDIEKVNEFTEAERDMVEQVKEVINDYDKETLINSIIYSFAKANQPISEAKAQLIYKIALKSLE